MLGDKRSRWHISYFPGYENVPLGLEIFAGGGILHHRHNHRTTSGCIVIEEMGCNQEAPLGLGAQLIWWSWDARYRRWRLPCLEGWYNIVALLGSSSCPTKLRSTIKDLTHQIHVDAKSNRTAAVQAEDAHQDSLADLSEEFAYEIEKAYAVSNTETEKRWRLRAATFLQTEST